MKRTHKLLHVFLVIGLLAGLIGAGVFTSQPTADNVHPLLAHVAADDSDQMVSVIVQTFGDSSSVIGEIESLGGTVTKDLYIINAVSAELSAEAAMELAGSRHVRWISLDAPVMTTGRHPGVVFRLTAFLIVATMVTAANVNPQHQPPDLTKGGKRDENGDINLGPTGARGWIWGHDHQSTSARQILVTSEGMRETHLPRQDVTLLQQRSQKFYRALAERLAEEAWLKEMLEAISRLRAGKTETNN